MIQRKEADSPDSSEAVMEMEKVWKDRRKGGREGGKERGEGREGEGRGRKVFLSGKRQKKEREKRKEKSQRKTCPGLREPRQERKQEFAKGAFHQPATPLVG